VDAHSQRVAGRSTHGQRILHRRFVGYGVLGQRFASQRHPGGWVLGNWLRSRPAPDYRVCGGRVLGSLGVRSCCEASRRAELGGP
jgi:hypothetical protein